MELILVAGGAIMYWLAAIEVSARQGELELARLSAAMIEGFGLLMLFVDYRS